MKKSAGILPYKFVKKELFFFIAHPGGPFYRKKDNGFWGIVKGEFDDSEEPLQAAIREFKEETNLDLEGPFLELTPRKQKSGKMVYIWAIETDFPADNLQCNTFQLEWPPKSGKMIEVPELDKFEWFNIDTTITKLIPAQVGFVEELLQHLHIKR
ncbi:NUDIX hydrolase [Niastella vici]|uniref:NUDIX hydrolase n=1 Tax=Niastella vici TaxID=1703345 RepID=A0A1V9G4F5_9BACT|nr:NUDIX domain-containing protein [Niastella vici]OQP65336.1 NUDIX hydrolase [Niastella vici]